MNTLTKSKERNLSIYLAKILRHKAKDMNIQIDNDGWVQVDDLLQLPKLKKHSLNDIEYVV